MEKNIHEYEDRMARPAYYLFTCLEYFGAGGKVQDLLAALR
jgi:hypothetical protein